MAKNLNAPNSGNGSAGNTAGYCGIEASLTKVAHDHFAESTTTSYSRATPTSGALTKAQDSSTATDGLDTAN